MQFTHLDTATSPERVAQRIRQAILDGEIRPGDQLPSALQLVESFGVSRVVIREGLKALQGAGLIDVARRGRNGGALVLGIPAEKAAELLGDHLRLQEVPLSALVEFRVLVESGAAGWAGQRRSKAALDLMDDILHQMGKPRIAWKDYHDLDVAFHLAVVDAADNPCASVVMRAIREAISAAMIEGFRRAPAPSQVRHAMIAQHQSIFAAIAAGRGEDAERQVREHILEFYERFFPSELSSR